MKPENGTICTNDVRAGSGVEVAENLGTSINCDAPEAGNPTV